MGGWRKPSVKVDDEICSISMVIKKDVNTDFMWPWYRTHKGLYTVQYFSPVLQYSQILDVPFDDTELKLMTQRRGGGGVAQLPSCTGGWLQSPSSILIQVLQLTFFSTSSTSQAIHCN